MHRARVNLTMLATPEPSEDDFLDVLDGQGHLIPSKDHWTLLEFKGVHAATMSYPQVSL